MTFLLFKNPLLFRECSETAPIVRRSIVCSFHDGQKTLRRSIFNLFSLNGSFGKAKFWYQNHLSNLEG